MENFLEILNNLGFWNIVSFVLYCYYIIFFYWNEFNTLNTFNYFNTEEIINQYTLNLEEELKYYQFKSNDMLFPLENLPIIELDIDIEEDEEDRLNINEFNNTLYSCFILSQKDVEKKKDFCLIEREDGEVKITVYKKKKINNKIVDHFNMENKIYHLKMKRIKRFYTQRIKKIENNKDINVNDNEESKSSSSDIVISENNYTLKFVSDSDENQIKSFADEINYDGIPKFDLSDDDENISYTNNANNDSSSEKISHCSEFFERRAIQIKEVTDELRQCGSLNPNYKEAVNQVLAIINKRTPNYLPSEIPKEMNINVPLSYQLESDQLQNWNQYIVDLNDNKKNKNNNQNNEIMVDKTKLKFKENYSDAILSKDKEKKISLNYIKRRNFHVKDEDMVFSLSLGDNNNLKSSSMEFFEDQKKQYLDGFNNMRWLINKSNFEYELKKKLNNCEMKEQKLILNKDNPYYLEYLKKKSFTSEIKLNKLNIDQLNELYSSYNQLIGNSKKRDQIIELRNLLKKDFSMFDYIPNEMQIVLRKLRHIEQTELNYYMHREPGWKLKHEFFEEANPWLEDQIYYQGGGDTNDIKSWMFNNNDNFLNDSSCNKIIGKDNYLKNFIRYFKCDKKRSYLNRKKIDSNDFIETFNLNNKTLEACCSEGVIRSKIRIWKSLCNTLEDKNFFKSSFLDVNKRVRKKFMQILEFLNNKKIIDNNQLLEDNSNDSIKEGLYMKERNRRLKLKWERKEKQLLRIREEKELLYTNELTSEGEFAKNKENQVNHPNDLIKMKDNDWIFTYRRNSALRDSSMENLLKWESQNKEIILINDKLHRSLSYDNVLLANSNGWEVNLNENFKQKIHGYLFFNNESNFLSLNNNFWSQIYNVGKNLNNSSYKVIVERYYHAFLKNFYRMSDCPMQNFYLDSLYKYIGEEEYKRLCELSLVATDECLKNYQILCNFFKRKFGINDYGLFYTDQSQFIILNDLLFDVNNNSIPLILRNPSVRKYLRQYRNDFQYRLTNLNKEYHPEFLLKGNFQFNNDSIINITQNKYDEFPPNLSVNPYDRCQSVNEEGNVVDYIKIDKIIYWSKFFRPWLSHIWGKEADHCIRGNYQNFFDLYLKIDDAFFIDSDFTKLNLTGWDYLDRMNWFLYGLIRTPLNLYRSIRADYELKKLKELDENFVIFYDNNINNNEKMYNINTINDEFYKKISSLDFENDFNEKEKIIEEIVKFDNKLSISCDSFFLKKKNNKQKFFDPNDTDFSTFNFIGKFLKSFDDIFYV